MREAPHICIVTPGHLSTNPRVVKEATALSQNGFRVTVVCGRYIPSAIEVDRELIDPTWTVKYVAFGGRTAAKLVHLRQRASQLLARTLARAGGVSPRVAPAAHSLVFHDLAATTCSIPAQLYIGHYVSALPAAAMAAQKHGGLYAFDAEDFHPGDLPERPKHDFDKKLIRTIERRWLPGAAYVTAAAPLIAEAYVEMYGIAPPTVVLNTFPRTSAPLAPSPSGKALPGPSLYWFSQTIGADRGLETALEALAIATTKPHLYLRGTPAAGYRRLLIEQAQRLGVAGRLHFLDPVPPGELERSGADYDLGYVGETGFSANRSRALTNKLFSYLTSGLPFLASNTPAHRKIASSLTDAMTLFEIGDANALATSIDGLLSNPTTLAFARARAWSLGQEKFSWEAEAPTIIEAVSRVTSPP